MFNLDSFAESMKNSVPKQFSFTLHQLNLIFSALRYYRDFIMESSTNDQPYPKDLIEDLDITISKFSSFEFR